jgi:hypothetical protein
MADISHPPYSPDLAPCDLFLFPKMKLKLKGGRFDITEEIQAESQRVLDTLTAKYLQEGTTSRVMASDRPYGEFYYCYSVSPEYFGYTLVWCVIYR